MISLSMDQMNTSFLTQGSGAGGGAATQNQFMMAMQMCMQMLNSLMGAMGSMGGSSLPQMGGFGGTGGASNGLPGFLGSMPSLGGGGFSSPSYGGGGGYSSPSYGGGGYSTPITGGSGTSAPPMMNGPVGAPTGGISGITPYQGDLPDADRWSMCGLIAAQGMARSLGNDMPMSEIKNIASSNGYYDNGMKGPQSEVNLLQKMGIPAHMESNLDWNKVIKTVQSGRPVFLDTEQHYFVIEGYDPNTGKFDFGNSAKAMKASGGNTWYSPDELARVFGGTCTPRSLIYADVPLAQGQGPGQGQQQTPATSAA